MGKEWLVMEEIAEHLREKLDCFPPEEINCFYGNPLGAMVKKNDIYMCTNWQPVGIRQSLWDVLSCLGKSGTDITRLGAFAVQFPKKIVLFAFWEWLYSVRHNNEARLVVIEEKREAPEYKLRRVLPLFPQYLQNGYVLVMDLALNFAKRDKSNIPQKCFPRLLINGKDSGVKYDASNAAIVFKSLYDKYKDEGDPWLQIQGVPPHVMRLLVPKLKRIKAEARGNAIEKKISTQKVLTTHPGVKVTDWPAGTKKRIAKTKSSPTADLLVAIAIDHWLNNSDAMANPLNGEQESERE